MGFSDEPREVTNCGELAGEIVGIVHPEYSHTQPSLGNHP
jgi:hypothetical protein